MAHFKSVFSVSCHFATLAPPALVEFSVPARPRYFGAYSNINICWTNWEKVIYVWVAAANFQLCYPSMSKPLIVTLYCCYYKGTTTAIWCFLSFLVCSIIYKARRQQHTLCQISSLIGFFPITTGAPLRRGKDPGQSLHLLINSTHVVTCVPPTYLYIIVLQYNAAFLTSTQML
jgi:hypothetical protein